MSRVAVALLLLGSLSSVSSFSWVAPRSSALRRSALFSSVDVETLPEPEEEPTEPAALDTTEPEVPIDPEASTVSDVAGKADLVDAVTAGPDASASQRIIVNELLLKVERANPTEAPATSPLLNGVWELVYTGGYSDGLLASPTRQLALFLYAGGYTPGNFGLQLARLLPASLIDIGDISVSISREQPRAESSTTVKVGNSDVDVKIVTTLETESDVRLKETYTQLSAAGRDVDVPDALQYSRLLYVTYLDDDLMVVRDESGVPEILVRKSKEFLDSFTGEPSFADDDLAPGAG